MRKGDYQNSFWGTPICSLVGSSKFSPGAQKETEDVRWALISF